MSLTTEKMHAERLYNDMDFYDDVVNYAFDAVKFYNIDNSKQKIKNY